MYVFTMICFRENPVKRPNKPSPKGKHKSILHAIGGGWYVKKIRPEAATTKEKYIKQKISKRGVWNKDKTNRG